MQSEELSRFFKRDRFAEYNGIELLEVGDGRARSAMKLTPNHLNGLGIVHGAAIFALADFTFAAASNSRGNVAVAINANISYMKSVSTGTLYAEAREVSINHKLGTYTIDVTNEAGELLAVFQGMVYRKKEKIDQLP
ncbi:putative phenylacetic acid degradation-related protein [Methanocella conradii HZ254]|uniref:Phenylacetic acid degradation-related protein n=1 Tax=Methanocella conradii (strain DSM 24694 / JCM 17849 / CGMCC 1.5162 / HZ254) TaxID=1041930 RepID=H8I5Y1_METCZ|nr:PaaI family thioesterase [Methanocella conradii]AFD00215.1 putative phenylacetic acid degradation-related protein [Methanocella conradii HZ254]MDI6895973.1 PaaI family thioesterase [Methanocella conradii]